MSRDNAGRGLQIVRVSRSGSGDLCDGDGRSIRREDRVLRSNLGELGEDGSLEVWNFGNGFDHHVHGIEVLNLQAGCDESASGICCLPGDAFLGDIFLEKFIWTNSNWLIDCSRRVNDVSKDSFHPYQQT